MRSMRTIRETITALFLGAALATGAAAAPTSGIRPSFDHNDRDYVSREIGRRYVDGEAIPVKALLNLNEQFHGRRLEFVRLRAGSEQRYAEATLYVNNAPVGPSQSIDSWDRDYVFHLDSYYNVLGSDIRTLQIRVRGRIMVQSVGAQLDRGFDRDPGHGYGDFLQVRLNQYLTGNNVLNLRRLLGIGPEFRGREIQSVIIRASSDRGRGTVQLRVDGYLVGSAQTARGAPQDYTFYLDRNRNRVDRDFQSLELETRGQLMVESVAVQFASDGDYYPEPGRPGRPGRPGPVRPDPRDPGEPRDPGFQETVVNARVARYFDGVSVLSVLQLLNLDDRRFEGRQIQSVTITGSTSSGRGYAELQINGRSNGENLTFGSELRSNTFFVSGFENTLGRDIRSLDVVLRGSFYIESVSVSFEDRNRRF